MSDVLRQDHEDHVLGDVGGVVTGALQVAGHKNEIEGRVDHRRVLRHLGKQFAEHQRLQQVQLVIGLGVLTGAVLSLTVHPNWVFLCAFFGAGLTFAGVSGFCGMAKVLALAPWNRPRTA